MSRFPFAAVVFMHSVTFSALRRYFPCIVELGADWWVTFSVLRHYFLCIIELGFDWQVTFFIFCRYFLCIIELLSLIHI